MWGAAGAAHLTSEHKSEEIKTCVLGFGSLAKVLEPAALVKEIKDDLEKSLKFYGKVGLSENSETWDTIRR